MPVLSFEAAKTVLTGNNSAIQVPPKPTSAAIQIQVPPKPKPSDDQVGNAKQFIQTLADHFNERAGYWQNWVNDINNAIGISGTVSAAFLVQKLVQKLGIGGLVISVELWQVASKLGD